MTSEAMPVGTRSGTPQVLLGHHLKQLKLPTILREYEKVARECARDGVDHPRYLLRLIELELIDRERRTVERRIRAARFPATKSFDTFDFTAIPSLNKMLVIELAPSESNGGTGRECGSKLSAVYRLRALVTIRNVSRSNSAPWRFGSPSRG